jgi:hypothetical protein
MMIIEPTPNDDRGKIERVRKILSGLERDSNPAINELAKKYMKLSRERDFVQEHGGIFMSDFEYEVIRLYNLATEIHHYDLKINAATISGNAQDLSQSLEKMERAVHEEKDSMVKSGVRSKAGGIKASHELYGTPEEREVVRQAYRDKFESMRKHNPHVAVSAIHAAMALQFNCTQRTIRRYLRKS